MKNDWKVLTCENCCDRQVSLNEIWCFYMWNLQVSPPVQLVRPDTVIMVFDRMVSGLRGIRKNPH